MMDGLPARACGRCAHLGDMHRQKEGYGGCRHPWFLATVFLVAPNHVQENCPVFTERKAASP